jgi:hypothetical protein
MHPYEGSSSNPPFQQAAYAQSDSSHPSPPHPRSRQGYCRGRRIRHLRHQIGESGLHGKGLIPGLCLGHRRQSRRLIAGLGSLRKGPGGRRSSCGGRRGPIEGFISDMFWERVSNCVWLEIRRGDLGRGLVRGGCGGTREVIRGCCAERTQAQEG